MEVLYHHQVWHSLGPCTGICLLAVLVCYYCMGAHSLGHAQAYVCLLYWSATTAALCSLNYSCCRGSLWLKLHPGCIAHHIPHHEHSMLTRPPPPLPPIHAHTSLTTCLMLVRLSLDSLTLRLCESWWIRCRSLVELVILHSHLSQTSENIQDKPKY